MVHEEGELEGVGGVRLYRQAWLPDGDARAVVVLAHGGAEHSGRYAWVGEQLAARGYALHALDHRGHGRSDGRRAYFARLQHPVDDLRRLIDLAAARHHGLPLFLFGHSMGGCLATAAAIQSQDGLAGLLLSAPLASIEAAPLPLRVIARTLSRIAPTTGVYQVDSNGISTDPAVVRAYEDDPLVFRGKLAARTVVELGDAVESFPDGVGRLTLPLLVMHSPQDTITPFAGGELIHARAGSADKTLLRYEGFAHELLNEPDRARVLGDMASWLDARA